MTDLPMFDDPPPANNVVAIDLRKPRRKKAKKVARNTAKRTAPKQDRSAAIRMGIARAKKAKQRARLLTKVKAHKPRRGRPPGSVNKRKMHTPKADAALAALKNAPVRGRDLPSFLFNDVFAFVEMVVGKPIPNWQRAALEAILKENGR